MKPHCPIKCHSGFILDKDINCKAFVFRPDFETQNVECLTTNSFSALLRNYEKLAQINFFRLFPIKCISNYSVGSLK